MPKPVKQTYAERLTQKRLDAINASKKEVAASIWGEIVYVFECYSPYELECFKDITVTVLEDVQSLIVSVTTTNLGDNSDKTEEFENIFMSDEKLNRIASIMRLVMQMAEHEGVYAWRDVDDDNNQFWGFCVEFDED